VAIRSRPVARVVGYLVLGDTPLGVRMHNNTSRIQPQLEALGQTISISASKQLTIVSRYYASEIYETVPKTTT